MKVESSTITGACGVGVVHDFDSFYGTQIGSSNLGGAGWQCAGFIEGDKVCDKVFQQMSYYYKLVYKTPTRVNVNSGNMFYFAIFDTEESGVPTGFDACDRAENSGEED